MTDSVKGGGVFFSDRGVPLHAMLIGGGMETRTSTKYDFDGLRRGNRPFCIFQYTLDGEGALRFGDRTYALRQDEAMLLSIPQDHRYYLPEHSPFWKFIHLSFNGREAERLWKELTAKYGPVVRLPLSAEPVRTAFEIVNLISEGGLSTPFQASGAVYRFLMELFDALKNSDLSKAENPRIRKAVRFCIENLSGTVSVEDMARAAGCSRSHFTREFQKEQGLPPGAFLREMRLTNAQRHLQFGTLELKEIAAECGFFDESHFCRLFRKRFGITPDAFRNPPLEKQ